MADQELYSSNDSIDKVGEVDAAVPEPFDIAATPTAAAAADTAAAAAEESLPEPIVVSTYHLLCHHLHLHVLVLPPLPPLLLPPLPLLSSPLPSDWSYAHTTRVSFPRQIDVITRVSCRVYWST